MNFAIREVTDTPNLERIIDLEILIWGLAERDAVPSNVLHPIIQNGGVVLATYDDDQPIGLSIAFPTNTRILWSHITGIHPDYRNQGIGYQLKYHQRKWAQQHGYKAIHWTFDPLQRRNAHFNINVLGASVAHFHPNFYGQLRDGINAGLPSHRLEVRWPVDTNNKTQIDNHDDSQFLLASSSNYEPDLQAFTAYQGSLNIEIPYDINKLKRENTQAAHRWSSAVCDAFAQALLHSYEVIGFITDGERCWYTLTPPRPWYLYVVQCNDDSLYTGITTDVIRRIQQHNAGRGAAYTAARRPVELRGVWSFPDQSTALRAEIRFKRQHRKAKLESLDSGKPFAGGQPWTP